MWLFYGRQVLMADFAMMASRAQNSLPLENLACFRLELMIFVNIQRSSNASSYLEGENAWAIIHPSKCLFSPPDGKKLADIGKIYHWSTLLFGAMDTQISM